MKSERISERVLSQEAPHDSLYLLDILTVISKHRLHILCATVGIALLTTLVVFLIPSEYTAVTLLMPPGQNSSLSSALLTQVGGSSAMAAYAGAGLGIKNPNDMFVSLFRSRSIEDAMIQRFDLMRRYKTKRMSDTRIKFEKHSNVTLGAKDGLLNITVTDYDPNKSAEMANAYVEEFRRLSERMAITEASQRRAFFQQQLLEANQNLASAEESMKQTQQSTGVLQMDSQARSLIESAAALRAQVVAKEVQLQAMTSYATEDNPDVARAREQLSALKAQLGKLSGNDSGSDLIVSGSKVPQAGMEYIRKLRDVRYYETISELIAKQFEIAKLDEAKQGAVVQIVDVAVVPDRRSFPKRVVTVLVSTAVGLLFSCGWFLFSFRFKEMKQDADARRRLDAMRATF